jgi:very-short-patch-repair endonuclease
LVLSADLSIARSFGMPRFVPYRRSLTSRARSLRGDQTPAERKLWYEFLRELPQKFTRQKPLGTYVADFYCSRQRLVIELDGDSHFTAGAEKYDATRTNELGLLGLRVLRFTNAEVMETFEGVCLQIKEALKT